MRDMKWSPDIIGDLFIDNEDYEGLEFWYDDVVKRIEEMKKDERR